MRAIFSRDFSVKRRVPSRIRMRQTPLTTTAPRAPSKFLLSGLAFLCVLGALLAIIRSRPLGESVRTGPRPHCLSSLTLDFGLWTLDSLERVPSRRAEWVLGSRCAPNDSATCRLPSTYRAKRRAKNPAFLRVWKQLGKFRRSKSSTWDRWKCLVELAVADEAREWQASSHPVGVKRDRIGTALSIPGLRCAPTWAIESRPVGAEETSHAADNSAFNARLKHAFC